MDNFGFEDSEDEDNSSFSNGSYMSSYDDGRIDMGRLLIDPYRWY